MVHTGTVLCLGGANQRINISKVETKQKQGNVTKDLKVSPCIGSLTHQLRSIHLKSNYEQPLSNQNKLSDTCKTDLEGNGWIYDQEHEVFMECIAFKEDTTSH